MGRQKVSLQSLSKFWFEVHPLKSRDGSQNFHRSSRKGKNYQLSPNELFIKIEVKCAYRNNALKCITQKLSIFSEEKRTGYEIDTTANYILFFESVRTKNGIRR